MRFQEKLEGWVSRLMLGPMRSLTAEESKASTEALMSFYTEHDDDRIADLTRRLQESEAEVSRLKEQVELLNFMRMPPEQETLAEYITQRNAALAKLAIAERALEFYADENKWFMREEVVNLQRTTAAFHVDNPETLPTDFKTKSYECSARIKMDQGKRARTALEELRKP